MNNNNDGKPLTSMSHPDNRPWWKRVLHRLFWFLWPAPKINPESIETVEIEIKRGGILNTTFNHKD